MTGRPRDFNRTRLIVADDLAEGRFVEATAEQRNYLINVLRLGGGDEIALFNGRDGEWIANLEVVGKRQLILKVGNRHRAQAGGPDLWYLFSPLKHARLDYMVQKATELGVAVLQPVLTRFTQAERTNLDRMAANVREAAQQCGILRIPEVRPPLRLDICLDHFPEARRLIFCDEAATGSPLARLAALGEAPLAVLIGPEGGFADDERARLQRQPNVVTISLGPRIMRADTAAVAALSLVNAAAGDWR